MGLDVELDFCEEGRGHPFREGTLLDLYGHRGTFLFSSLSLVAEKKLFLLRRCYWFWMTKVMSEWVGGYSHWDSTPC